MAISHSSVSVTFSITYSEFGHMLFMFCFPWSQRR